MTQAQAGPMSHPNDPERERKRMGLGMQVAAWVVLIALLTWYFGGLIERQRNPNRNIATHYSEGGLREVVLERNRQGHYVAVGAINGQPVEFLLDTGATTIAIPARVAHALRLPRGRSFRTRTANGITESYETRLGSVSIGDITLYDVEAGITPGLDSEQILLGMSFLRHIEFSQRGNTLTLRQYPPAQ